VREFLCTVDAGLGDHWENEHGVSVNRLARIRRAHAAIDAAIAEWEAEAASDQHD
jgi:hypothetical protein